MDDLFTTMNNDTACLSKAMSDIAASVRPSATAESPTKKKRRNYKEISESIRGLLSEKKELKEMGESTEDVDKQLAILRKERSDINQAPASGASLGSAFDKVA